MNRNVVIVVATMMVCITILLVAFYVWPTPYRYEKHGPNGRLLSKTESPLAARRGGQCLCAEISSRLTFLT